MITYGESTEGVSPDQLDGFFVGWPNPPSPETHLRILAHSDAIVLALNDETSRVVGYITAITDHVLAAYIPHLEVLPDHQGQGIGHTLVERMLVRASEPDIGAIPSLSRAQRGMIARSCEVADLGSTRRLTPTPDHVCQRFTRIPYGAAHQYWWRRQKREAPTLSLTFRFASLHCALGIQRGGSTASPTGTT